MFLPFAAHNTLDLNLDYIQQASDCDLMLAHDDDLVSIDGLGHDTVSGLLKLQLHCPLMLLVTGNPRTRCGDRTSPEVQHRDR
jgi:hypothetical protein